MARIRLQLPEYFSFSCEMPVRITDLNYGGHTGNDTILSLIHEARMQFLKSFGYTEMELEGVGTIMADAAIEYKNELFYPETLRARVAVGDVTRIGFELYYKLERINDSTRPSLIALAKTTIVCYDYSRKKVTALPPAAREKFIL